MAIPPKGNTGSNYFNINQCRSFSMIIPIGAVETCLSGVDVGGYGAGQACSEVIIVNRTGGDLTVFDKNHGNSTGETSFGFVIANGGEFTFRGLTNVNEVSAKAAIAGPIYYRTQFFSYNPR